MGLFAWLRRRKPLAIDCWLDEVSRWRGFTQKVEADLAGGSSVLVVAHFKEALATAGEQLARAGVPFEFRRRWTDADTKRLCGDGPPEVFVVAVGGLPAAPAGGGNRLGGARPVSVRLVDLHVLADENERAMRFARGLPAAAHVSAGLSLEDPLLAAFAKPWVRDMLARLGMSRDAAIESPMVSRSIHRALAKLAARTAGNAPADSIGEWLERNLRE